MTHASALRATVIAAFALCLCVVVLGAYVRLTAAGLGCPDWPGCYGHFTPAGAAGAAVTGSSGAREVQGYARPLEVGKAWREMVHRYAAGTLGFLIVCIAAMAIAWRRERLVSLPLALAILGIVVVQGVFGMLTVTWMLKPLIVTLHLLFGFTTLSLLWWLMLTLLMQRGGAWGQNTAFRGTVLLRARRWALLGLCVLALQIALGGWTSSNYAATACPDLPTCQGSWWPKADFHDAYVLWRNADIDYQGGTLDNAARVAIHLTHRMGALVTTVVLLSAAAAALRYRSDPFARRAAQLLMAALALQLLIGTSMVLRGFPLWLATAHNAGAALLLLATLALNRSLQPA
jgi:heme a synthase